MKIIKYEDKYFDGVRNVCHLTASKPFDELENVLYLMYCDYYLKYEKDNCFILLDGEKVVGYIISSGNTHRFCKYFKKEYMCELKKEYLSFYKECKTKLFMSRIARLLGYPSHLHIDILPEYQKMGYGRKLMETLFGHLTEEKNKGIFLACGIENDNAAKFYRAVGFKEFMKNKDGYVFVKRLRK